jgi:hypothetical protein
MNIRRRRRHCRRQSFGRISPLLKRRTIRADACTPRQRGLPYFALVSLPRADNPVPDYSICGLNYPLARSRTRTASTAFSEATLAAAYISTGCELINGSRSIPPADLATDPRHVRSLSARSQI